MDPRLFTRSVQDPGSQSFATSAFLNIALSSPHSIIEPWGRDWVLRDRQLAEFWPTESYLASAIASIVMTRASLTWQLEGPPKSVSAVRRILNQSDFGRGWSSLMAKVCLDLSTQDNGAFAEIIRDSRRPGVRPESAPVLGLAHLPALRCIRTGNPFEPVIYINESGKFKTLKWYQVITFEELPSTLPGTHNRQVCFVSRVIKAAEIIRDITTYQGEKVSGRFLRTIHMVGGVSQPEIERMERRANTDADNMGLLRYMQPIIMAALDPNAKVSHVQIDLASLPDGFDFDETMKWYISVIAMAAGGDFQDFAPLPGGNLGTASQSETLHRKSQRKGHALFMKMVEDRLQQANVLPRNVTFRFNQQDAAAEMEQAQISQIRAATRAAQIQSGEISATTARRLAVEAGDLKHSHLIELDNIPIDETQSITLDEDEAEPVDITKPIGLKTAWAAAKAITTLIENHPMNDYQSLNPDLLQLFTLEVRNALTHETHLTTSSQWQCDIITNAAKNAGISPHLIRLRLPDNLVITANHNGVFSNMFNHQIYKPVAANPAPRPTFKQAQVAATSGNCFKCGNSRQNWVYIPTKGWQPVCDNHLDQGLIGRSHNPQYNKAELIYAFKEQYAAATTNNKRLAIFISAICYANELKYGTIKLDEVRDVVARVKESIGIMPPVILAQYIL